jgi:hypothetical protein
MSMVPGTRFWKLGNIFPPSRYFDVFVLGWSLLIFLGVRAILYRHQLLNVDEAHFAACAARVIDTNGFAIVGCRDSKPPGIFWLYETGFRIFGAYNITAVRWLQAGGVVLAAVFLYLAAGVTKHKSAGAMAAGLFLLAMSMDQAVVAAKTEALAVLPMCLGMWALVRAIRSGSLAMCAVAGVAAALASLCKQPAGIILLASLAAVSIYGDVRRWRMCASVLAGFAAVHALVLGIYLSLGGLQDYIRQTLELPSIYASIARISMVRRVFRMLTYTEEYGRLMPIMGIFGSAGVAYCMHGLLVRWRDTTPATNVLCVASLFAVTGVVAAFAGADLYLNYFIMAIPGLAACAGIFLAFLFDFFKNRDGNPFRYAMATALFVGLLGNGVLALKEPAKSIIDAGGAPGADPLASVLKTLTTQSDRIYVWGYSPDVYVRADRVPASRYVLTDVLVGFFGEGAAHVDARSRQEKAEPGAWARFFEDLERTPPRVFVDASQNDLFGSGSFSIDHYPELESWLAKNYVLHSEHVQGAKKNIFKVYLRRDG